MSIIDARTLGDDPDLRADVCIVGAGAAGLTLATALVDSGVDVCVVESGGLDPEEEVEELNDLDNVGYPVRENFMSRARYFGGSCNLWAGRCMKLGRADLAGRSWVPQSAWPIPYEELERLYPAAARVLELPSVSLFDWGSFADRMSDPERRLFSDASLEPTVSLWAKKPLRFGAAYGAKLRRSGRARVVLHSTVTAIRLSDDGSSVDAVEARTLSGDELEIRARNYVLACGALENARLLLVSRGTRPAGIGNQFDLVGRYFMDHPRSVYGRVRLRAGARLPLVRSRPLPGGKVQLGIGIAPEAQEREGLLNHYATLEAAVSQYTESSYQSFVQTMKVLLRRGYAGKRRDVGRARFGHIPGMIYLLTPKELMPHFVYRWHTALRDALPKRSPESCVVVYFCEQPPDPESRVKLSGERDRLGVNRIQLQWRIDPRVTRTVLRLQDLLGERLEGAGIGELAAPEEEVRYTDASHHMGTTRMGSTPRQGVVDPDCRVHDVSNLYVSGGSVFPSAGHANPTLTIVALALRLAEHLQRSRP